MTRHRKESRNPLPPTYVPSSPSPLFVFPCERFGVELVEGDGHELLGAGVTGSSSSSPAVVAGGGGGGPSLGRVLPLHCGHNNAYGESERRMLLEHLAVQG